MQHCVRNYNTHDLRALLSSEKTIGFVRDASGSHALKDALLLEKRASAVLLLDAVADGRVPTMASCLSAVTECFPLLSRTFPELLLDLALSRTAHLLRSSLPRSQPRRRTAARWTRLLLFGELHGLHGPLGINLGDIHM